MSNDVSVGRISEMEGAMGGALKRVRAHIGVSSFGLAVLDLPPDVTRYPEHDHRGDRQEEVYLLLRGTGWLEVSSDGAERERIDLDEETFVRVGPSVRRKVFSGPEGARLLIAGGTPGEVYDPPDWSKLGQLPLTGGA